MSEIVYFKVEPIPNDENGDWRAVAEWSNEGGLVHLVVYGQGEYETMVKPENPTRALLQLDDDDDIAWEEVSEMEAPY